MKTEKEIEKLATAKYGNTLYSIDEVESYKDGYLQCQENMKEYIFQVAMQFHRLGKYSGHTSDTHFTDIYEETINLLNKQDNE